MKVESKTVVPDPAFNPIQLTLTLETAQEAQALFALFNHPKPTSFLRRYGLDPEKVRASIRLRMSQADNLEVYGYLRDIIES